MVYRSRFLAVSAVAALACVSLVSAASISAKAVTLKASDVPSGYKLQTARSISNAQMSQLTHVPKAQFDQHGRITGYLENFKNTNSGIVAFVFAYKTAAGAHWDYTKSTASDQRSGKRVTAPKVGDESVTLMEGKGASLTYVVDFHRGNYDNTIAVTGKNVTAAQAVHYAQIVAGRES